jgi:hypothetical protein
MESEGSNAEFTYDEDGKIIFIRKPAKSKFGPQSIRTRVVDQDHAVARKIFSIFII